MSRSKAMYARSVARGLGLALFTTAVAIGTGGGSSYAAHENDETCDGTDEAAAVAGPARRRSSYEILPDVNLPSRVEDKIKILADRYKKHTGKSLVVTSGTRDAPSQAEVIFDKLESGDDIVKLYRNKGASLELVHLFMVGRGEHKDRSTIVATLTEAIRAQMKRGVFISAHLRAGAADVRSSDMTANEKQEFVMAAGSVGGVSVMLESTPAHFHLQLAK